MSYESDLRELNEAVSRSHAKSKNAKSDLQEFTEIAEMFPGYRREVPPMDFRRGLKVKIKTLAIEAKMIRKEELKSRKYCLIDRLRNHRVGLLRDEQRATLLAYGYIRRKTYRQIEATGRSPRQHIRKKALRMINYYSAWDRSRKSRTIISKYQLDRWFCGVEVKK